MSKYETVVVFDGALPEEAIAKEQLKIEELIKENGTLDTIDVWGKKNLAYTIGKKKTGFYIFFQYDFTGDANELISGALRYNDKVIRTMTVLHNDAQIVAKKVAVEETTSEKKEDA